MLNKNFNFISTKIIHLIIYGCLNSVSSVKILRKIFLTFSLPILMLGQCIFAFSFVCFLSLLQVAAVYRDPSVGNLINIMVVKLVVIHNEQVSVGSLHTACLQDGWRQCRCASGLSSVRFQSLKRKQCFFSVWSLRRALLGKQMVL